MFKHYMILTIIHHICSLCNRYVHNFCNKFLYEHRSKFDRIQELQFYRKSLIQENFSSIYLDKIICMKGMSDAFFSISIFLQQRLILQQQEIVSGRVKINPTLPNLCSKIININDILFLVAFSSLMHRVGHKKDFFYN